MWLFNFLIFYISFWLSCGRLSYSFLNFYQHRICFLSNCYEFFYFSFKLYSFFSVHQFLQYSSSKKFLIFFNNYLAAPWPSLGYLLKRQPHSTDINHIALPSFFQRKAHEAGLLNLAELPVGLEPGSSRFRFKGLTHCVTRCKTSPKS